MRQRLQHLDNNLWLWAKVNAAARWDLTWAGRALRKTPGIFDDVACYCAFVGYPRSGHSVVGSILDAHPNVAISHRLDALKYASKGCSREEVFYMIVNNSRRFARSGRHLTAYRYPLPGQGSTDKLTVIGDQEGQHTSRRLRWQPDLLRSFFAIHPPRLRFIHVIRNPFDNIATMANRRQRPVTRVIGEYFELCRGVLTVKSTYGDVNVLDVYHEDFVGDPATQILRLCGFLDLPVLDVWAERCAEVVYKRPNSSRKSRDWRDADIRAVQSGMARYQYLARYRSEEIGRA